MPGKFSLKHWLENPAFLVIIFYLKKNILVLQPFPETTRMLYEGQQSDHKLA